MNQHTQESPLRLTLHTKQPGKALNFNPFPYGHTEQVFLVLQAQSTQLQSGIQSVPFVWHGGLRDGRAETSLNKQGIPKKHDQGLVLACRGLAVRTKIKDEKRPEWGDGLTDSQPV